LHAVSQQLPVPVVPQTPLVHASLDVHMPIGTLCRHLPVIIEQYAVLLAQSVSKLQLCRQSVLLALHVSPPEQVLGMPGMHEPSLAHVPTGVSVFPKHCVAAPHGTLPLG
jgi:hypothetical protein